MHRREVVEKQRCLARRVCRDEALCEVWEYFLKVAAPSRRASEVFYQTAGVVPSGKKISKTVP
jgi:hypothetical protein